MSEAREKAAPGWARTLRALRVPVGFVAIWVLLALGAWATPRFPGDEPFARVVQAVATPWLDHVALALDFAGEAVGVAISVGVVVILRVLLRRFWEGGLALLVLPLLGLSEGVKVLIHRPRPAAEAVRVVAEASGASFPSTHAVYGVLFLGLLVHLVGLHLGRSWWRWPLQGALVLLGLATGLSRVYLGVHWPSDVLGGFLLGGLFLWGLLKLHASRPA